jgi:hypothetical protein
VSYAAAIVDSLPSRLVEAAHAPYAARALVYALLVSRDGQVRTRQLALLEQRIEAALSSEVRALLAPLDDLDRGVRLPLVDMSLPALLALTDAQYRDFSDVVSALMAADERLDLFEWALQRVLLTHLAPNFDPRKRSGRRRVRWSGLRQLGPQLSVLLSTLARVNPSDPARVARAFDAGVRCLEEAGRVDRLVLLPVSQCGLGVLDEALRDLADAAPGLKRAIVTAAAEAVCSDDQLTVDEAELLRAVSDALGCPMPPILAGGHAPS